MIATLTPRQAEFVRRFHDQGDRRTYCHATNAAAAAGYRWPGKQGPRLMTFPVVKAEIDRQLDEYVRAMRAARKAALLEAYADLHQGSALARAIRRGRPRRPRRRRAGPRNQGGNQGRPAP